ncbi:MAG TPA: hypothetical protein PLZ53_10670 [Candidatus Hydrogenedentes bacterium]|jgi:hypothetical protein|nr:hypothetical protein [Candidatus Hydrogenedentota bacterium]HOH43571.1 hypothetical protein [Candidatus Hydrogenedentota bacterium]HOM49432.1 hypothetical protein [Candidatus Hydrogenedentota bacterium]HOR51764.1 hypothetical protein [Candidatus Hydrogenedentota bacterium]HPK25772.1 hypothetical protein [Candidatus Hydrogenedentota bacterium]
MVEVDGTGVWYRYQPQRFKLEAEKWWLDKWIKIALFQLIDKHP